MSLQKEVNSLISKEDIGTNLNGLQSASLLKKLLKDLKLFPVWGNVYRNKFGDKRVPATSASSESEFNKMKNTLLRKNRKRVDAFVDFHLQYFYGRVKLDNAAIMSMLENQVDE